MSGGHYDYAYVKLYLLADEIEKDFINDGKYEEDDFEYNRWGSPTSRSKIKKDRLEDANKDERAIILLEVRELISELNSLSGRCKNLEWFLSGNLGVETYVKLIKE